MATSNSYTGNGSTTDYSFTFPYLKVADVKASIDGAATTAFSLSNATTVKFDSAPGNLTNIRIYRETDTTSLPATFYAGSAIKSQDLNDNFTLSLYTNQEVSERYVSQLGGTMTGNLILGEDVTITFEGATSNAYETVLTVVDPTADRTITLPNSTDTLVGKATTDTLTNKSIDLDSNTVSGTLAEFNTALQGDSFVSLTGSETLTNKTLTSPVLNTPTIGTSFAIGSATITEAELEILDGATVTTAELNILDGVTATASELNILDGVTSTTSELNILDGVTATATELNKTDGLTSTPTELNILDGATVTTSEINKLDGVTASTAELNIVAGKTFKDSSGTLTTTSDTEIPSSKVIAAHVSSAIGLVGGFTPIANDASFPATASQPDNGIIISIADAQGVVINGSGVSTTGRTTDGTPATVTINSFPSSLYSETLASGVGLQVVSTGSSNTYTYHKLLAAESDVKQLSDDINDFNARYRVASSAPGSANDAGDLYFDTSANKMKVYNGTTSAWDDVASVGSFYINTLSSSSETGGGSATFNGSAYRFTLSNPGTSAQQHIVSVNGVLQKPNSGAGQPAEGFAISGNDILFSAAPASASNFFIITQGSSVSIGTPSADSINSSHIIDGSIVNGDISSSAGIAGSKLLDDSITEAKLDIHNAPSGTDKFLAYTSNGLEWAVPVDTTNTAAADLTGSTLASGVTASSLTSLGTIASLTATAATISDLTVSGPTDFTGLLSEACTITAGKLSDNANLDLANGNIFYFSTAETTTSTPNLRWNSSTTLDSKIAVGDTITVTIITTAAAAGYSAQLTIDGSAVTENWVGGSAPDAGGSSGVDVYTYTIIKTGSGTFVVIGNLTKTSA